MEKSTHIVVDLGFGDAGKGTMVDALARKCSSPPLVVRHNGGAQAGHNVHTKDGRHHTFSQFGAGTFAGAKTLLSKHMVVHPLGLMKEYNHLTDIGALTNLQGLFIDERALVITPFHQAMNRAKEIARGKDRHGTCGLGIGDVMLDSLDEHLEVRMRDLKDLPKLKKLFQKIRDWKIQQVRILDLDPALPELAVLLDPEYPLRAANAYFDVAKVLQTVDSKTSNTMIRDHEHVIFEGAQGVLIDEWYGFHPHTTWSTTTTENALSLMDWAQREGPVTRLGVVRSYSTRHGEGPFPAEGTLPAELKETHNVDSGWQGKFRTGAFDLPLTKYALEACPVDALAMTHCDYDRLTGLFVDDYYDFDYEDSGGLVAKKGDLKHQEWLGRRLSACKPRVLDTKTKVGFPKLMAEMLKVPLIVESVGPCAEDKVWCKYTGQ